MQVQTPHEATRIKALCPDRLAPKGMAWNAFLGANRPGIWELGFGFGLGGGGKKKNTNPHSTCNATTPATDSYYLSLIAPK